MTGDIKKNTYKMHQFSTPKMDYREASENSWNREKNNLIHIEERFTKTSALANKIETLNNNKDIRQGTRTKLTNEIKPV